MSALQQSAGALPAADQDGDEEWEDLQDDDVADFLHLDASYTTPADAVKAFADGAGVEWIGSVDGALMRHRVVRGGDGTGVIEQAVFVTGLLERMLVCAWYQAGPDGQAQASENILAALDVLHSAIRPVVEADVRAFRPDYTAAVLEAFRETPEPHCAGTPVFGWRTFHTVEPETTWDDIVDTATWNSSVVFDSWHQEDTIPELEPGRLASLLTRRSVPLVLCSKCGNPITDRHPRWTGVWASPGDEGGPLCDRSLVAARKAPRYPSPRLSRLTDGEFGDPHLPTGADVIGA
ncbi:hypothetical protein [Streptomyces zaomyceticus]|uniref:hypothetical protein n=1 Tax=Streptomyces zaomyceticus TaxID=68286 RepID=UPI003677C22D